MITKVRVIFEDGCTYMSEFTSTEVTSLPSVKFVADNFTGMRVVLCFPVNMTILGQYRPSTAYITGPLQCVSNGPITFCTSFLYRPDTCSRYWPGNGPLQYGTGPVCPHTVLGQYRTGTVVLYRFGTGPITFIPGQYWPGNGSLQSGIGIGIPITHYY